MTRAAQQIQDRYDTLLFAKTADGAREAAHALLDLVLGERAHELSFEEALRECCRRIRPATDPREQSRFESEFVELAIWPDKSQSIAA